jgi:large subunit ribosomal protein L9
MQVILLERVAKLGQMGDTVTVKDGFARNFLLPQKKAMRATESNLKFFETERARLEADNLKRREEAEAVASKMAGLKCVMVRSAGESGQLYGSVTSRDIAEAVTESGVSIKRSQVVLDRAIKTLGLHDVVITLHPEVSETVVVNIARSDAEAETQFEIGGALVSGVDEEEEQFEDEVEAAAEDDAEAEASEEAASEEEAPAEEEKEA